MKNLNKDEKSDFEKSWEEAFNGAELEPSEDVWLKIDGVLANQESKGFKKKIIFYKYAAAVSIILLLSTAVVSYFIIDSQASKEIAGKETVQEDRFAEEKSNTTTFQDQSIKIIPDEESITIPLPDQNIAQSPSGKGSYNYQEDGNTVQKNEKKLPTTPNREYADNSTMQDHTIAHQPAGKEEIGRVKDERIKNADKTIVINNKEPVSPFSDEILISKQGNKTNNTNKRDQIITTPEELKKLVESYSNQNEKDLALVEEVDDKELSESYRGTLDRSFANIQPIASKEFLPFTFHQPNVETEIYRVPVNDYSSKKSSSSTAKEFFAGVQFSPNYFDPNIQMSNNFNSAMHQHSLLTASDAAFTQIGVNPANQEQELQPQISYTYGLNFGLKVAKRWLVNMGVQYARNNTIGTTQQYIQNSETARRYAATPTSFYNNEGMASNVHYLNLDGSSFNRSVDLINNFEFASIPVKAGFIIVDKKISWIISSGVATDIFIKNEIQDENKQLDKEVIRPGETSPFRNVFFNGLASTEVVYHLSKNYSISIEPSFRSAISSFAKSESGISSLPQSFGVAAGFRYVFK